MRVSVKELLRNFSMLSDRALSEPVIITKNGRDRLVLLGIDEYSMLKDIDAPAAEQSPAGVEGGPLETNRPKRA